MACFPENLPIERGYFAATVDQSKGGPLLVPVQTWEPKAVGAVFLGNNAGAPMAANGTQLERLASVLRGDDPAHRYALPIVELLVMADSHPVRDLVWSRNGAPSLILFLNGSATPDGATTRTAIRDGVLDFLVGGSIGSASLLVTIGGRAKDIAQENQVGLQQKFSRCFAFQHPSLGDFAAQFARLSAKRRSEGQNTNRSNALDEVRLWGES
ncbi:MAG: hypothetical protein JST24_01720 [Acidobacteria bacterium]|nr:hypothetical protein [Acidobacteriota bacterium]